MLCQAGEQLAHCEGDNDGDSNFQQQGAGQALLAKMGEDLDVGRAVGNAFRFASLLAGIAGHPAQTEALMLQSYV